MDKIKSKPHLIALVTMLDCPNRDIIVDGVYFMK